ncbi:DNA-3-methyladenine glycosylase [Pseudomonas oryzihabitans]|nr:DNA-3-methyladenine glycosylase [Pseudomonas psychrotolerans]
MNQTKREASSKLDFYKRAADFLSSQDSDWAQHIGRIGCSTLITNPRREPYEALIRAVAYQQLHAKAGDAILDRLTSLFPDTTFPTPGQLLSCPSGLLRACGFSAKKVTAITGLALATERGIVPSLADSHLCSDERLVERLTSLPGIGRWTVEMLLIYTLERGDILPADDFGVRDGYRRLKGLSIAPNARQMRQIGASWSPYRTVATWYLWRVPKM